MGHFLLIAIINASTPSANPFSPAAGYQSSVMQQFDSVEHCKTGMTNFLEIYQKSKTSSIHTDRGFLRCVDLDGNKIVEEMSI